MADSKEKKRTSVPGSFNAADDDGGQAFVATQGHHVGLDQGHRQGSRPVNPEDPGVALVEALTWSVLTGVNRRGVQAARDPGL